MTTTPTLGRLGIKAFEHRKIDVETAERYGVFTGSRNDATGAVEPDERGNIIVFPFRDHGVVVAKKYRAPGKKFWQDVGGKRTFWNADALDDPALETGHQALVITEGEIDALSAIECGFPLAVSVPDGAPSVPEGKAPEDLDELDPDSEKAGKFEFLYNNRERLKRVKRFILAVDSDGPGRRLAAELVRRLGAVRCSFVTYPLESIVRLSKGGSRPCKDLNEVLVHFGQEAVVRVLNAAKPYPVRGLYKLSEYPEASELETYAVGFEGWDAYLRLFPGEFMVVSGVPSHGKSVFVLNMLRNLALAYGWKSAICSPEMPTVPVLRDRFRRMHAGRYLSALDVEDARRADSWTERHFVFIDTDPTGDGDSDEPFDLEWIIERATDAVLRDGIRVLVIDPWNEVEHAREKGESMVDYIARGIRMLKRFARMYQVAVIVVAHPTKDVGKDGKVRPPGLYDIEGAAHWYNKCDHGIIVHRPDTNSSGTDVHILKVKFEETGQKGKMLLDFDRDSGLFRSFGLGHAE